MGCASVLGAYVLDVSASGSAAKGDVMLNTNTMACSLLCALGLVACRDEVNASTHSPLIVECAAPVDLPSDAWVCDEARSLSCDELATARLYVPEGGPLACEDYPIRLANDGPFSAGATHTVIVESENGEACSAQLTVIDETPPHVTTHTLQLWPPNHKLHTIDVNECITAFDDCGGELRTAILWASSDEPVDDIGDGHHAPDIKATGDGLVSLRAERQGGADGRVYTLGVRVTDPIGNYTDAECHVVVPHDQSDHPLTEPNSGEAYRLVF